MAKSTKRQRQIADVIQHQLAYLLKKSINDPRLEKMSITGVEMSPDLGYATIYYSLLNDVDKDRVALALKESSGHIRHLLAQAVKLRYMPYLRFKYDESLVRASRIVELLDKTIAAEEKRKQKRDSHE